MKVILKRHWFTPEGDFIKSDGNYPVEVPDRLKDFLPRDAKIVGKDEKVPVKPVQKQQVLRDFDEVRRDGDLSAIKT